MHPTMTTTLGGPQAASGLALTAHMLQLQLRYSAASASEHPHAVIVRIIEVILFTAKQEILFDAQHDAVHKQYGT